MAKKQKKDEGGGEYRIIKNGKIFEKVGVNFSKYMENFQKNFKKIFLELVKIQDFGLQEFQ